MAEERFDTPPTLTSTEAAGLLGVHASTVKRWCNEGALEFMTTPGGHRRFPLAAVTDFAREKDIRTILTPFHPYEPHVWSALREVREVGSFRRLHALAMGWVHRGQMLRLGRLYEALGREPGVDLCAFCDEGIRGLMRRVGDAWQSGKLRVGEEHMVSQVMFETILKLREDRIEDRPDDSWDLAPVAVVGALEGNQHHLGSMCVRVLLEAMGWRVHYLGPDVPLEDFAVVQRGRAASLVCISLAPPATVGDVARAVDTLGRFYDASAPYALAFGGAVGGGVAPDLLKGPFRDAEVFSGCVAIREAIQAGFARPLEGVAP
jgi:excisionase family DNA binding protein